MNNNLPLILPLVVRHASVVYQKLEIKQLLQMHAIIYMKLPTYLYEACTIKSEN